MTDLIIGLCIGIACAAVLLVMWRMVEKLRRELQSGETPPDETRAPGRHGSGDGSR